MEAQIQKLISIVSTLIALQVVTLAMIVGVTWYSHDDLKRYLSTLPIGGGQPSTPQRVENWEPLVREHNATLGRQDAAVVVVEYSDFQCPFCRQFAHETRREIAAKYGDQIRMVFKHYPLQQIHPQAMTAAIAAQCARREGKFWEVHERFFSHPDALDIASVIAVGESLELSDSYVECVINEKTRGEVEQDIQDASEVGVRGTPTFMVNGDFLVGNQTEAAFEAAFRKAGLAAD
jgi:NhaA family Na+:H+ antiporter